MAFTNPKFIKNMFAVNKLKPGSDMYTRAVVQYVNDLLTGDLISKQNVDDFINEGVQKNYLNEDAKNILKIKIQNLERIIVLLLSQIQQN